MSREDGFRDHGLCEACSSAPCLCATMAAARQPAVHILKYGRAYCGKSGPPGNWPPAHRWVSFEDDWAKEATCEQCLARAALDPEAA